MGIEIPPPKGGPAVFTNTSSPRGDSPVTFSPEEDRLRTPEFGDDLNDGVSLCLSEGGASDATLTSSFTSHWTVELGGNAELLPLDSTPDSQQRDENGANVTGAAPLANVVLKYVSLIIQSCFI